MVESREFAAKQHAKLVIDTNVVLDMLVFDDEHGADLLQALMQGKAVWLVSQAMRQECARVLNYPQIAMRCSYYGKSTVSVLTQFDALSRICPDPVTAPYRCKDPDDQMYIDLALAHCAQLVSKDKHVLAMRKRLGRFGVLVGTKWCAV
jgi:putative PIN family toxin of toxin-antitoxin system